MDGQQESDIAQIIIVGTMGMIILAMGIIVFFFVYQRKIMAKEGQIHHQNLLHQKMLTEAVIKTKESEKRRLALELHDDVGSTLTALKFSIPGLKVSDAEQNRLTSQLQSAIQKVRRISNELLPSILEELGLESAVRNLITQLDENPLIKFEYHFKGNKNESYPKDIELAFYRVLQELLNNIQKYAEASEVYVDLQYEKSSLALEVVDNGNGFIPQDHTSQERPSLGLKNMESRIQIIEGKMIYSRMENKGTKVTITWNQKESQ